MPATSGPSAGIPSASLAAALSPGEKVAEIEAPPHDLHLGLASGHHLHLAREMGGVDEDERGLLDRPLRARPVDALRSQDVGAPGRADERPQLLACGHPPVLGEVVGVDEVGVDVVRDAAQRAAHVEAP